MNVVHKRILLQNTSGHCVNFHGSFAMKSPLLAENGRSGSRSMTQLDPDPGRQKHICYL
jgi:hypothetical protein